MARYLHLYWINPEDKEDDLPADGHEPLMTTDVSSYPEDEIIDITTSDCTCKLCTVEAPNIALPRPIAEIRMEN